MPQKHVKAKKRGKRDLYALAREIMRMPCNRNNADKTFVYESQRIHAEYFREVCGHTNGERIEKMRIGTNTEIVEKDLSYRLMGVLFGVHTAFRRQISGKVLPEGCGAGAQTRGN